MGTNTLSEQPRPEYNNIFFGNATETLAYREKAQDVGQTSEDDLKNLLAGNFEAIQNKDMKLALRYGKNIQGHVTYQIARHIVRLRGEKMPEDIYRPEQPPFGLTRFVVLEEQYKRRLISRREMLRNLGALTIAGGTVGGGYFAEQQFGWVEKLRRLIHDITAQEQQQEATEIPAEDLTPLEAVLAYSLPITVEASGTIRDNFFNEYTISKYFLWGRFRYLGNEETDYNDKKQRVHHFAVIGEKSGSYGRDGEAKNMWKITNASHAVRALINLNKSEEEIKAWLVWLYKKSFNVRLDPGRIRFSWKKPGELEDIFYDAPAGTQVTVEVAKEIEDRRIIRPGRNISKTREDQDLVDEKGRLKLPTGIEGLHDVVVPTELMRQNPHCTLEVNGALEWKKIEASMLAERIAAFKKRRKETEKERWKEGRAYGRDFRYEEIAPLILREDTMIKALADYILKDVKKEDHRKRIMALVRFVQKLPYKWEYDTDIDRPAFVTLFNGGGDCNNVTILFVELMLAAGYDAAILHTDEQKQDHMIHAMGGIPAEYLEKGLPYWRFGEDGQKFVAIELAGDTKWGPGDKELGPEKKETVFAMEILKTS